MPRGRKRTSETDLDGLPFGDCKPGPADDNLLDVLEAATRHLQRTIGFAVLLGALGACTNPSPPSVSVEACPRGATLEVQLWDVYATPRKPNGEPWDGVSSSTIELVCSVAADRVRRGVREAIDGAAAGAGRLADNIAGDAFEAEVAELCGLAGNWLQMAFEGPDMFALGAFDTDAEWRWQSYQVEDSWAARLSQATDGLPSSWEIPCGSTSAVAVLSVIDADLAFDDDVGAVGLDLASIGDQAICDGWAYFPGADGIAGVLVRLHVLDGTSSCE